MRRPLLGPLVGLLALMACSDDDGGASAVSAELQPYAQALSDAFTAEDNVDQFAFTPENGDCVGARTAEIVGIERFRDVGTPEQVEAATADDLAVFGLDPDEVDAVAEGFLDCVEDSEQILEEAFLDGAELTVEQEECITEVVDRDLLVTIFSAGISGQDPAESLADVRAEFAACT